MKKSDQNQLLPFRILGKAVAPEEYLLWAAVEDAAFHFGQSAEDAVLLRLFHGKTEGFYVDVGAFHPRQYSNTFILHQLFGWRGVNIDASKEAIALFERERPNDINICTAVGAKKGKQTLYKFDRPARNTLSQDNLERQKQKGDVMVVGKEEVAVAPLADILRAHVPKNAAIDVMNVDIEGFDIQALESNDWQAFRPKVVLIEDYEISQGGTTAESKIHKFMAAHGYKFHSHTFDTSIYVESSFRPEHHSVSAVGLRRRLRDVSKNVPYAARRAAALAGAAKQDQLNELQAKLHNVQEELKQAEAQKQGLAAQHQALLRSRSWKLTTPVRKAGRVLRKAKNKAHQVGVLKDRTVKTLDPLEQLYSVKPAHALSLRSEYKKKGLDKEPDTFVLYRVIGNDLYPRHKKGQSRQNLQFILEHEPELEGCEKRFIVNRIIDKDEERAIIKLLKKYKKDYTYIPFVPEEYRKIGLDTDCLPEPGYLASAAFDSLSPEHKGSVMAAVYRLKNNYIMNNNGARNAALADGKKRAKWVLPWDGNCFVTAAAWEQIKQDVTNAPYLKYFAVPMARILDNAHLLSGESVPRPIEEPQLIFRSDAKETFNEAYCYGRRPKVELFWRLGIPGKWDQWKNEPWDQPRAPRASEARQFGVAGWVARMFSGAKDLEQHNHKSFIQRGLARNEAIISTIRYVDELVTRTPLRDFAFYDGATLDKERTQHRRGKNTKLNAVVDVLISSAREALGRQLEPVTEKTTLPPSGDPHDYWSTAPYWWPNPNAPDGLPYIRKDGEWAPGSELYGAESDKYDRTRLQRVFNDSITLALAWKFTGEDKYALHASETLERFFVNPATRMNPHLTYAQVRMGHNNNVGGGTGIIELKDLYYYLDAVRILDESGTLREPTLAAFKDWLTDYLQWLLTSPQGKRERVARNNHGTLYDLQVAAVAEFLEEKTVLFDTIARAQTRIEQQFAVDGSQPEELTRTNTAHYCCFNYQEWINLARVMSRWGIDVWGYEASNGGSLLKGAKWLLAFAGKTWPYEQIDLFDDERFSVIRYMAPEELLSDPLRKRFPESPYDIKPLLSPQNGIEPNPYNGIQPYWNLGLKRVDKR